MAKNSENCAPIFIDSDDANVYCHSLFIQRLSFAYDSTHRTRFTTIAAPADGLIEDIVREVCGACKHSYADST